MTVRAFGDGLRVWTWGLAGLVFAAAVAGSLLWGEMNWGREDVLALGALLAGGCLGYELVARATRRPWLRLAGAAAVALVVILVWAELAVGIFR
ncbi:hypothetical protein LRS10_04205 [Phenylobacterium sp. J426]|uniref:hypothetical protein n=1 Tax=Phenylobacterium sp. J426 TaxID=2898439 RepID=UPI002150C5D8|nr:hypothetical protein [Phenylobacterium sp. J426]MCR5873458.1 hypothetical protein [Phenylobacterium sp. J426]